MGQFQGGGSGLHRRLTTTKRVSSVPWKRAYNPARCRPVCYGEMPCILLRRFRSHLRQRLNDCHEHSEAQSENCHDRRGPPAVHQGCDAQP